MQLLELTQLIGPTSCYETPVHFYQNTLHHVQNSLHSKIILLFPSEVLDITKCFPVVHKCNSWSFHLLLCFSNYSGIHVRGYDERWFRLLTSRHKYQITAFVGSKCSAVWRATCLLVSCNGGVLLDKQWLQCGLLLDKQWLQCGLMIDKQWLQCGLLLDKQWLQ
jgi:hypothetical protein